MPVEYRAGASSAHPHALVQLWAEAARGGINHHPVPAGHGHVDQEANAPRLVVADRYGPDVPELSSSTGPAEHVAAFAAAGASGLLVSLPKSRLLLAATPVWRGRTQTPEPPPPRGLVAC